MSLTEAMRARDFEQVVVCRDPGVGLESVIAVHDTTLGPSLGGIRMRAYADHDAALADALDLAEAMTYKAALAGLDLGGGKSVINADPRSANRNELLAAHARFIGSLGGRYIPAVDMGTTVDDLDLVGRYVQRVSSQRRDPSPYTALGVVESIRAAVQLDGRPGLDGVRIAVQGLGHVGQHVAKLLAEAGAHLVVADINDTAVRAARDDLGATVLPVEDIMGADVDVLCPCAAGGVIDAQVLDRLKARYVIGAANNVLTSATVAVALAERGVVHVPDFVANAGGLIACAAEVHGDDSKLSADVERIAETTTVVLRRAAETGRDTVSVAVEIGRDRLAARRAERPRFM
jgi:leucine dehydrogenase